MVPEWSFIGLDHLWYQNLHHESTLYVIIELFADFQLPSVIRCASRNWSYLEDIDGPTSFGWDIAIFKVDYISFKSPKVYLNRFLDPFQ